MAPTWNILMVDDEPDIHAVTRLALKRKRWRSRSLNIISAYSGEEAESLIRSADVTFHVALIDVVMETEESGLQLCSYIRNHCPRTFRIILRTGQPGVAPEEHVLNEYDIDYYLSKVDATPERIYNVLRACLRSSEDIATLIAYSGQLRSFTEALSAESPTEQIVGVMTEGLSFLERKHRVRCVFVPDVASPDNELITPAVELPPPGTTATQITATQITAQIKEIVSALEPRRNYEPQRGDDHGLPNNAVVIRFDAVDAAIVGGLGVEFMRHAPSDKEIDDLAVDARLFIDNWRVAFSTLTLREQLAREATSKAVMEKELEVARAVQATMVPDDALIALGSLKLAAYYQPATHCGGDWWNYYRLADDKTLVVIGDVTGHGAGSAMITATAKGAATATIRASNENLDLSQLLGAINTAIYDAARGSYPMTCFASIYDGVTGTLSYANAGHNFPYIFEPGGEVTVLASRGSRLGALAEASFSVVEQEIHPGSTLLWYTDGITELRDPDGVALGEKWLHKSFKNLAELEPDRIRDELVAAAQKWAGDTPLEDDVTLVVGRVAS